MTALGRIKRRADRAFYRALHRLYRAVLPTNLGPGPVHPEAVRRVLVAPRDAVGDLVMVTPLLSYLRDVAPHARVDVLASRRNASLLEGDPRVDGVLVRDVRGARWLAIARELRRERYDVVANAAHSQHARQGWFTALVAGRRGARVTVHRPRQYRGFFTHVGRVAGFEHRHHVERLLYALQRAVAAGPPPAEPETGRYPMSLAPEPEAAARAAAFVESAVGGAPFVAVNCWASLPMRTLDEGQAAAIVSTLAARYPALAFVLTPPPSGVASAETIAADVFARVAGLSARRLVVAPPSPRLADLVALLARAAVVLTPDTANVHLAAALGRPVVGLYNSTWSDPFTLHRPFGVPYRVVALPWRRPLRALRTMPPAAVVAAFDALWDEVGGGAAPEDRSVAARAHVVPPGELGE